MTLIDLLPQLVDFLQGYEQNYDFAAEMWLAWEVLGTINKVAETRKQ